MVRIALVDDHSLFRRGLKMLLTSYSDFEVVAEASSGEEFLELMDAAQPDVVFMDYSMGGMNGAETTERALERMPELKVISLTMFGDNAYYSRMSQSLRSVEGFPIDEHDVLSDREVEILVGVCQGLSTQEIADRLFISKRTVDKHRANILEKSGCKNTASLVVYAIKNGLVEV